MEEEKPELSEYEQKMVEIEEEKLETLKGLRKDLKHYKRMESFHKTIEELGVDKEDVVFLVKYLLKKFDEFRGEESEVSDEIKSVVTELVKEKSDDENFHVEFSQQ